MKKKKAKKWIRPRHYAVRALLEWPFWIYTRLRYGMHVEPFREQEKRPYLILLNHQTPFDQFFAGLAFKGPVYYMATEDIFSLGWISSVIRWLVAPIPIKKQTTDANAVMTCIRVAREGGTICIAPEGNRTYSGRTEYMNPAIAGLAKKLRLPIALFRIEGGYGAEPRWSDKVRKGRMHASVVEVISAEEVAALSREELAQRVEKGLYVDEAVADIPFRSEKRAEYIERMAYVCPFCGLSTFHSEGNITACTKCGRQIEYGADKRLKGVGFEFPFPFAAHWYDYQKEFINKLDVTKHTDAPLYRERADVFRVLLYKKKQPMRQNAELSLYGDRLVLDEGAANALVLPFEEVIAAAVLGRNKLNVYHGDDVYQFKGSKHFNALKYVHIYYRFKNISRGNEDDQFLGL